MYRHLTLYGAFLFAAVLTMSCGRVAPVAPQIDRSLGTSASAVVAVDEECPSPMNCWLQDLESRPTAPRTGLLIARANRLVIITGGHATRLAEFNPRGQAAWGPGPGILFDGDAPRRVYGVCADGTLIRELYGWDGQPPITERWSPSWSDDNVLCTLYRVAGYPTQLFVGGREYTLGPGREAAQARIMSHGRTVMVLTTAHELYRVEVSTGRVELISARARTLGDEDDQGRIVWSETKKNGSAALFLNDGCGRIRRLTHGHVQDERPKFASDGRIIFNRTQHQQRVAMELNLDGGSPRQIMGTQIGDIVLDQR